MHITPPVEDPDQDFGVRAYKKKSAATPAPAKTGMAVILGAAPWEATALVALAALEAALEATLARPEAPEARALLAAEL